MREGIFFFRSFYDVGRKLSPKDRLAYYDAVLGYAFEDIEPKNLKGYPEIGFISAKPVLDSDKQKYLNGQKAAGFGKLGGRPKQKNNPQGFSENNPGGFEKPKGEENPLNNKNKNIKQEQEQEQEKSKGKVAVAPSVFRKPSITEIAMYCKARNNNVDAEAFWNFYESKGWKVGNATMKDWKAAVITWEKRRKEDGNNQKYSTTEQRTMVCHDWSNEHPTL